MARGKGIGIDFAGFAIYAEKIDELGGNLEKIFSDLMEQAAETVEWDVADAMAKANLPAGGKYSDGQTETTIIRNPKASTNGSIISVPLGFDKTKVGAGGYLITGTPKMRPNYELEDIFVRKKYFNKIKNEITEELANEVARLMGK